jgi:deoxyribose-phosphate aldolase
MELLYQNDNYDRMPPPLPVKAAGGVRTYAEAAEMIRWS